MAKKTQIMVKFGHISEPEKARVYAMEVAEPDGSYVDTPTMSKLFDLALNDAEYDLIKRYFITVNGTALTEDDVDQMELNDGDQVLYTVVPDYDVVSADNLDELVRKVNSMYPRFVANGGLCWDGKQYHQGMALAGE